MTAPRPLITASAADVNAHLSGLLSERVAALMEGPPDSERELEMAVWEVVIELGAALLTACLAAACWRVTERATRGRPVRLRLDEDYTLSRSTTFGTVGVPLFAYRDGPVTRCPARKAIFPLHPKCRSSVLLLEWEARLGSQLPFRQAEDGMAFFTHGAARTEDTTISRHIGVVGPSWTTPGRAGRPKTWRTSWPTARHGTGCRAVPCCTPRPTRMRFAAMSTTPGRPSRR